jgi:hypothetical protein
MMNADGGVSYSCFNCNFKASYIPGRHLTYKFRKLLSWLGTDDNTVRRLVIEALRVKDLINPDEIKDREQHEITFKAKSLPEDAVSFHQYRTYAQLSYNDTASLYDIIDILPASIVDGATYLNSQRKIDTSKYDFYVSEQRAYNLDRRVIIPFTWKNEIIGYTARAYPRNNPSEEAKPKYYSQIDPGYVYNVDKQLRNSKFVIVCEGPFDAMSIDGVAILGNEVSEQQAEIIDSLEREVIVVADADKAGVKLIDSAIKYGWSVSFPEWQSQYKDINSAVIQYGKLYVLTSIIAAKCDNKLKIELMKRKL